VPRLLPDPDTLYDTLMAPIEKELTNAELPLLAERYKNETPEETKARAARYELAFAAYGKAYKDYTAGLEVTLHKHQRAARHATEHHDRTGESDALTSLESRISDSAA
jgi:hypothetical protein